MTSFEVYIYVNNWIVFIVANMSKKEFSILTIFLFYFEYNYIISPLPFSPSSPSLVLPHSPL